MTTIEIEKAKAHAEAAADAHQAIVAAVTAIKLAALTGRQLDEDQGQRWHDMLTAFKLAHLPDIAEDEKALSRDIVESVAEIENRGQEQGS